MKKRLLVALTFLFALILGLGVLSACGDSGSSDVGDDGVSLTVTDVTIGVGVPRTLTASTKTGGNITWTSSDETVVGFQSQVPSRGIAVIIGLKGGTSTLTATNEVGKSASCTVTVEDYTVEIEGAENGKVTLLRKADGYESKTLTAKVYRSGQESNESVTWSSSDSKTVSVENGVLTAHKIGEGVVITATHAGGNAEASVTVDVKWESEPAGWYEVKESGSAGAMAAPGTWTWSGFQGTDDVHPELQGEGSTATGKVTFTVSGNTGWRWYGAQLFYKHPGVEDAALVVGSVYKLTFKLESTAHGFITVNETDVEVNEGTQTVELYYREAGGDNTSVTIALATHDKIRNQVNPIEQYPEGTLTISDMNWAAYTPEQLTAPTAFTIAADSKEVTVTETNDVAKMEGYLFGFFEEGKDEPTYTQPIMKPVEGRDILEDRGGITYLPDAEGHVAADAGKMYLDDSFLPAGTYTVKVKTFSGLAQYAESNWSEATQTYTKTGAADYKVLPSYRDVDRGLGRFYVWSEWDQYDLGKCFFKDNTLTLTLTGQASWYSNQVLYYVSGLTVGHNYSLTFTFNAKDADEDEIDLTGKQFAINGSRINPTKGATEFTVNFTYEGGAAVTMLLGQPTEDWQGTVENGGLAAGTYTFANITLTDAFSDPDGAMAFGDGLGSGDEKINNKLVYWYATKGDFAEWKGTISMNSMKSEQNAESDTGYSYNFKYSTASIDGQYCNWIFRLWYKNSENQNGAEYNITLTIVSSEEGDIKVNGETVHLQTGEHSYKVYYVEGETSLMISMATDYSMTGMSTGGMDVTFKSIKWAKGGKAQLQAPTEAAVTSDGTVSFTDPNNKAGVDRYEIGLFRDSTTLVSTQTIEKSGDRVAAGQHQNGHYTVKVRFCGDADHKDTDWVTCGEYTVADGYDLDSRLEQDTDHAKDNPGQWYHWLDRWDWEGSTAKATKSEIDMENKTFTFGFTTEGTPRLGYGVQLYFKNPGNEAGKLYELTANITLSVDGTITVNDRPVDLKAGQATSVKIRYTEKDHSISIQTGVYQGTPVMNGTITISGWAWEEITSNPNGETYDLVWTTKQDDGIPADSTFYYWSEWPNDGISNAKFDHGVVTFHLAGKGNWHGNRIFYKGIGIPQGEERYTFTMKIESTVAGTIRVNETFVTLEVGVNEIKIENSKGMVAIYMGEPPTGADGKYDWDHGGNASTVENGDFKLSDFLWEAADGTKYDLNGKIS